MSGKKKLLLIPLILVFLNTPSKAVMMVQDNTLAALLKTQIANDTTRTSTLMTLNWTMGAVNSFFARIGTTQQMYEDFLNAHGLGGTKLGRYASHVLSQCIQDQLLKLGKIFKIPPVMFCGTNLTGDLANYLGQILNQKLNAFLRSVVGQEPQKKKSSTSPVPPGTTEIDKIADNQIIGPLEGKDSVEITDENGKRRKVNLSQEKASPDGNRTYKDSTEYIVENSLINTAKGDTATDFALAANTGDKENLGNLDSPEIRQFYLQMAKHYVKVAKQHRETFLRHAYSLKRTNDFFNTTFLHNKDKNKPEQYTIDVPIPLVKVEKTRKIGNGNEGGCLFTSDYADSKLGGCYVVNTGISFIPERTIAENPERTLREYTEGINELANKVIRKMTPDGSEAAREFKNKFDIERKIREIEESKDYKESGINFATLSELVTAISEYSTRLVNMKSPDGRDYVKISLLRAILYQLTILNQQIYLYNKVNTAINVDRYNEIYTHVLNIEKELQKIRIYETFYLRKILLK